MMQGKKVENSILPKWLYVLLLNAWSLMRGMSVYDPTAGSGGMLLETVHYLERHEKNPKSLTLYAQEMNLNTWSICKMNLLLHDIDDAFIARGDTLRNPKHLVSENS